VARFLAGHATHPDWRMALALAAAQIDAQAAAESNAAPARLGFVYVSDHYAADASALHTALQQRWPDCSWVGCTAVGVSACGAEYIDEPALSLMLAPLPTGSFEVFSGARPLPAGGHWHSALLHADPQAPELQELIHDMASRVDSGYLFGGLVSSRSVAAQFAGATFEGGLTGVAFAPSVGLISRVTQGCQPVGPERVVTAAERNLVLELDGRPALDALLADLDITLEQPRLALPRLRATLAGLTSGDAAGIGRGAQFGPDVRVRHVLGLDPGRQAVAVAEMVEPGMRLAFCTRDVDAARRDLVRICSEIRDELDPGDGTPARTIAGAIYISCAGRGGPHFGGESAELQIVRHALGEVPLVGFFGAGEIARHHLYGYTGVLTVFANPAD
jgi:small ligand-binding sensory domain FIST